MLNLYFYNWSEKWFRNALEKKACKYVVEYLDTETKISDEEIVHGTYLKQVFIVKNPAVLNLFLPWQTHQSHNGTWWLHPKSNNNDPSPVNDIEWFQLNISLKKFENFWEKNLEIKEKFGKKQFVFFWRNFKKFLFFSHECYIETIQYYQLDLDHYYCSWGAIIMYHCLLHKWLIVPWTISSSLIFVFSVSRYSTTYLHAFFSSAFLNHFSDQV